MSTSTSRTIEVVVSPAGETTVQTQGFAGASCQDASRSLEQALGEAIAEQKTPEFYQQQAVPQTLRQSNG